MIALDCHPFSIVEDGGFISLIRQLEPRYTLPSRRYITEKVVTKIYMHEGEGFYSFKWCSTLQLYDRCVVNMCEKWIIA